MDIPIGEIANKTKEIASLPSGFQLILLLGVLGLCGVQMYFTYQTNATVTVALTNNTQVLYEIKGVISKRKLNEK